MDVAVETAGAHEGLVQDVGPVGAGQHDDLLRGIEAVHLGEDLVQGGLPLVVTAADALALSARFADSVDLVDEDDAGGVFPRRREEVAHPGRTDTDEHLDELGTAHAVEGHAGLARGGLGEHGFTGTGGPGQDGAAGNLGTEPLEPVGLREEADELHDLLLGLVHAGDVGKPDFDRRLVVEALRPALPHAEDAAAATGASGAAPTCPD